MSNAIEIDGKKLHPVREAAKSFSYSRDYITRLAREEKIFATRVANQWFVDIDSIKSYEEVSTLEQEVRKKQLSEDRRRENQIRTAVQEQQAATNRKQQTLGTRAMVAASLVLGFGLVGGVAINETLNTNTHAQPSSQTAKVSDAITQSEAVSEAVATSEDNLSTQSVESLGDIKEGVLLLPNTDSVELEKFFADRVLVKESIDGEQRVVQVDQEGNEFGNEIPFVTVPVIEQNI